MVTVTDDATFAAGGRFIRRPIHTLGELLTDARARFGDADALVFPDQRLSHAGLAAEARRWAKALVAIGVQPGQNIGILLPTRSEFVAVLFGIAMAGAVAVPLNARYQSHELAFVVPDADLVAIITTGHVTDAVDFAARLRTAFPELATADPDALALDAAPLLRRIVCLDTPCPDFMTARDRALWLGDAIADAELDARIAAVDPADTAIILYTSGTTANPKGAMLSHRALTANPRNLGARYEVTAADKVWSPLPIFHVGGILTMTMIIGAGGAYLTLPFFDAGTSLAMIEKERATIAYPSFVTIMQDLISHPTFPTTDLSALRIMNSNFAVQPAWIKEAVTKAVPHTTQVGTYGLTEGVGTVTTSRLSDSYDQRTGRCGVVIDEWEVRIVDPETGEDCAAGRHGEIALRGPNMLLGYYKSPEKSAEALRGGWFYTGDIGSLDEDGHLMFHGRTKDMLKVGGENVAAAEIEAMLQSHPAVKLAQVVGLPDPRYVEVPAAFVELADDATVSEAELIALCKGKLARFKVPRHIRFVTSWPMSTSKIQKFRLRDALVEELEREAVA